MHPLNSSILAISSTGIATLFSDMPPTYIRFAAFKRFGNLIKAVVTWPFIPMSTRIVNFLSTLLRITWCHWPSFSFVCKFISSFLRPRTIKWSWPSRRTRPIKCFCFSLVPCFLRLIENKYNYWSGLIKHHAWCGKAISYRCEEKNTVRIERSKIKLYVEVLLPHMTSGYVNDGMTVRAIAKFKCIWFIGIYPHLFMF